MTYDVDYFIKKFEAIPEDKWTTGKFVDYFGNCCVYGHCGMKWNKPTTIEGEALSQLFIKSNQFFLTRINDGTDTNYTQPTPKQRILAALHDIKKLQTKTP